MKKEKENMTVKEEACNYDPYEELANAVVLQACNDYKKRYKRFLRRSSTIITPDSELTEVEEFFRSDWYKQLTEVDGEYLMECLKNEVQKQMKNA